MNEGQVERRCASTATAASLPTATPVASAPSDSTSVIATAAAVSSACPQPSAPPFPPNEDCTQGSSLEDFLGTKWYTELKTELDELGAEDVKDLRYLEDEEVEMLGKKLKPVQRRQFVEKMEEHSNKN